MDAFLGLMRLVLIDGPFQEIYKVAGERKEEECSSQSLAICTEFWNDFGIAGKVDVVRKRIERFEKE